MDIFEQIRERARKYLPDLIKIRRYLHENPELSFHEFNTSKFVAEELARIGLHPEVIAGTGVIATLTGGTAGSRVALRADLDALPIEETNKVSYCSKNVGVMHACGHDVHTACLLGAARILFDLQKELSGSVQFIFQPAEEQYPGGAQALLAAGVFSESIPDQICTLHVSPEIEVGNVSLVAGPALASVDDIFIQLRGRGGHAARPQLTSNLIPRAAELIITLQNNVEVRKPLETQSVLSFCRIQAGKVTNVIPDFVELAGTFRCLDASWRNEAHHIIQSTCEALSHPPDTIIELRIEKQYPVLVNDIQLVRSMSNSLAKVLGSDRILPGEAMLVGEDFAYFAEKIPAVQLRLGTGNLAKGITAPVHSSNFDIDESAIAVGAAAYAAFCFSNQ